jgi:hypothetical protein
LFHLRLYVAKAAREMLLLVVGEGWVASLGLLASQRAALGHEGQQR